MCTPISKQPDMGVGIRRGGAGKGGGGRGIRGGGRGVTRILLQGVLNLVCSPDHFSSLSDVLCSHYWQP